MFFLRPQITCLVKSIVLAYFSENQIAIVLGLRKVGQNIRNNDIRKTEVQ